MSSVPAKDLGNGRVACYCGAVMAPGDNHWCKQYGHYVKNPTKAESDRSQREWERNQAEQRRRREEFYGKK